MVSQNEGQEEMREDEWVTAAMMDDSLVAELLMRLNQSLQPAKRPVVVVPPQLEWGVRQPRSRQIVRCNIVRPKKEGELNRASPTTPLSWSGATSLSGGGGAGGAGDGYEESSRPVKQPSGGRSKVTATSETTIRRSRKKKTFAELKEEESLLLKRRIHLKKEIATLRINYEEQRARNKSLKRMKLDLPYQSVKQTGIADTSKEVTCDQYCNTQVDHTPTILPIGGTYKEQDVAECPSSPPADSCEIQKDNTTRESFFMLPDLNFPFEEDTGSEVLYGMS